jgi:capsular polysaccharide biosynthesis protein
MLLDSLKETSFMSDLSTAITRVRSEVLRRATAVNHAHLDIYAGCHLILARSAEPNYYAEGGGAERPKYGTSRRALTGIEEAAQELRQRGIPTQVFEPGIHSLTEQIHTFRHCRGVIGIKGAEFANLIWLKPASRVILIKPSIMGTPPVQMCLADVLGLHYVEVESSQGRYPVLDPAMIEQYLTQS